MNDPMYTHLAWWRTEQRVEKLYRRLDALNTGAAHDIETIVWPFFGDAERGTRLALEKAVLLRTEYGAQITAPVVHHDGRFFYWTWLHAAEMVSLAQAILPEILE